MSAAYNPSDDEVRIATEEQIAAVVEVIRSCDEFNLDLDIIIEEAKRMARVMDNDEP